MNVAVIFFFFLGGGGGGGGGGGRLRICGQISQISAVVNHMYVFK